MVSVLRDVHSSISVLRDIRLLVSVLRDVHSLVSVLRDMRPLVSVRRDVRLLVSFHGDVHANLSVLRDVHSLVIVCIDVRTGSHTNLELPIRRTGQKGFEDSDLCNWYMPELYVLFCKKIYSLGVINKGQRFVVEVMYFVCKNQSNKL